VLDYTGSPGRNVNHAEIAGNLKDF
jgi:hypothetical protein